MTASPAGLREAAETLQAWLVEKAYPLWWEAGADLANGGFHDRLDRTGRPVQGPKRARVAARQVFCFSHAAEFGWNGPWRLAMRHGLDFLEHAHRRTDGLYRSRVELGQERPDDRAELYDQAFALLALNSAERTGESSEASARELLAHLPLSPLGGFRELEGTGLFSNPNMHLFEVFIAWAETAGEGVWFDLARDQARLAAARLIDQDTGAIAEIYDDAWRPAADPAERDVWPGHQFEWAWLLMRFDAMARAKAASPTALRLIDAAERLGVDHGRNVAFNALSGLFERRDADARLWPQTERLKAHLLAAKATGEQCWWSAAERAAQGLSLYLEDSGLWRDQMKADGSFVDEPAPASSLYHIVGAILELKQVTGPDA